MIARRLLLGALAAGVLLAGCGTPTPVPAPATAPPGASPQAPQPPQAAAVALPWPTTEAAELQAGVDGGAQPWLLDPSEVALSYVAAARGWTTAQVVASSDGTTVDVTGPAGERRTLTLRQPDRTGPTGVWTVTADAPTP